MQLFQGQLITDTSSRAKKNNEILATLEVQRISHSLTPANFAVRISLLLVHKSLAKSQMTFTDAILTEAQLSMEGSHLVVSEQQHFFFPQNLLRVAPTAVTPPFIPIVAPLPEDDTPSQSEVLVMEDIPTEPAELLIIDDFLTQSGALDDIIVHDITGDDYDFDLVDSNLLSQNLLAAISSLFGQDPVGIYWNDFIFDSATQGAVLIQQIQSQLSSVENIFQIFRIQLLDHSVIDSGGVMKNVLDRVSFFLGDATTPLGTTVRYFTDDDFKVPLYNSEVQNSRHKSFFNFFGKYLAFVMIQQGPWPCWLHLSVVKFILGEALTLDDFDDLGSIPSSMCNTILNFHDVNDSGEYDSIKGMSIQLGFSASLRDNSMNDEEYLHFWKLELLTFLFQTRIFSSLSYIKDGFFSCRKMLTLELSSTLIFHHCYQFCRSFADFIDSCDIASAEKQPVIWGILKHCLQQLQSHDINAFMGFICGHAGLGQAKIVVEYCDGYIGGLRSHTCFNKLDISVVRYNDSNAETVMMGDLIVSISQCNSFSMA